MLSPGTFVPCPAWPVGNLSVESARCGCSNEMGVWPRITKIAAAPYSPLPALVLRVIHPSGSESANFPQAYQDHDTREVLRAGGSTALYDAIFLAVDEKLKSKTGRKVIVVVTDGDDTISKVGEGKAIETAQEHDVLIYGIGFRSDTHGAKFGVLKKFAEETGGRFISSQTTPNEMQAAFQLIQQELQNQYSLAYTSTNTHRDGSYRSIEVRCKGGGVRIRSRKWYYAPTLQKQAMISD
jgi:VWFA-related protein